MKCGWDNPIMQLVKKVWAKNLRIALGLPPLEMHALMARLAVLYEDLRIELAAASEESLPRMDVNEPIYRKLYFIRRSIATLLEIDSAVHTLNMSKDFRDVRRTWSKEHLRDWQKAIKAFSKWHSELNTLRNAIGGHFSKEASEYAVQNVHQDTAGFLIYDLVDGRPITKFVFAGELAAAALGKDRGDKPFKDYLREVFEMLLERFQHAAHMMHLIARYYLIFRFGEPELKKA